MSANDAYSAVRDMGTATIGDAHKAMRRSPVAANAGAQYALDLLLSRFDGLSVAWARYLDAVAAGVLSDVREATARGDSGASS